MPDESDVVRVLREFRDLLTGYEDGVADELVKNWLKIEARLNADISNLAYVMDERRTAGKVITEQMIWREERYQVLHKQIEEQLRLFNKATAPGIISNAQENGAMLGIRAANDALSMSYASAGSVGPYWNRINVGAVEAMVGFAKDGSPLSSLLTESFPKTVNGLLDALINGMARGTPAAQTAHEMADGMGMGLDRALLIARTETARAFRAGSAEQYRASEVCTGFYRLVKKETACIACLFLDGEKFETQDELEDHPGGHCMAVPQVMGVGKPVWEDGKSWFENLSSDDQEARMGPEKFELWQNGSVSLEDFAKVDHSDVWGNQPRVATLAELGG